MRLRETLRVALKALRRNAVRSVLTMLGVIIGVASVIAMISLGSGARSAIENVELPLLYDPAAPPPAARHEKAKGLLEAVGLGQRLDHTPSQLSGGQQQRVAIARSLVNDPELVLADEPTGNLDSRTSIEIMEILQRLNRERGITIMLITHEHDIAEYGTRVVQFKDGRVVSDHPVEKRRDAAAERLALPDEVEVV